MTLQTVEFLPQKINLLCAVCASDRSGGQIALGIIIASFITLGLINWVYKKYIRNNSKFLKKFKI